MTQIMDQEEFHSADDKGGREKCIGISYKVPGVGRVENGAAGAEDDDAIEGVSQTRKQGELDM